MNRFILLLLALATTVTSYAYKYEYNFSGTPLSQALVTLCKEHPDINISFIYKELDNYRSSSRIRTDNAYDAIRQIIGSNPVSVLNKGNDFYIEALQHGRFIYTGRAADAGNRPVEAAIVMLLSPSDSTVITYGRTDSKGRFAIPCDRQNVLGKISCLGYKTTVRKFTSFSVGTIILPENALLLGEVNVEADNSHLYADKSVYIPSSRQKKSSQTAYDLIQRMAIPQIRTGEELKTISGQPVKMFIDYVPATSNELSGMRTEDVKKVEYYDYPSDPRFQGEAHVINFIMQQYEYGGYTKGIYYDNFIISRQLNGYAKMQYKNMTYDIAAGAFRMNDDTDYENVRETFRLPQEDGTVRIFERNNITDTSKKKRKSYWASLKLQYKSDDISISNMLSYDFNHIPSYVNKGSTTYSSAEFTRVDYSSDRTSRDNSIIYSGYMYFTMPHGNSISFDPYYAYTCTRQNSILTEGAEEFLNGARDYSHQATGDLTFLHSFGKAGALKVLCRGRFIQNRTTYYGTSSVSDQTRTLRLGPGLNYAYNSETFHGSIGAGIHYDKSEYGDISESSTAPWATVAIQYALNRKNSISADFHYEKSIPASSYRSTSVIQADPLMSYTGNPALVPYNSMQIEGNYTFIPDNRFSLAAFGSAWVVDKRYVYDYEASPSGILRTIKQPMGNYAQWQYGLHMSSRFLDGDLQAEAWLYLEQAHNGEPYNWTKSQLNYYLSAFYYLKQFYFGASYSSPSGYPDGCMVGTWMSTRSNCTFQAGWSDHNWNLRFFTRNFFRFHTYQTKGTMHSRYYDSERFLYNGSYAGFFQISATYTFSFGKKIEKGNEAYQASGASNGILK